MQRAAHAALGILLVAGGAARGQEGGEASPPEAVVSQPEPAAEELQVSEPIRPYARVGVEHAFERRLRDVAGDMGVTRASYVVGVVIPAAPRLDLDVYAGQVWSYYDFKNSALVAGAADPWDAVMETRIGVEATIYASDAWTFLFGLDAFSGMEPDAEFEDSLGGGAKVLALYNAGPRVVVGGGVYVRSRLAEDDPLIVPAFVVQWHIDEHWSVSNAGVPGARVTYSPSAEYSFFAQVRSFFHDFVLDDDGPLPGGAASHLGVEYSLGAAWHVSERFSVRGRAGLQSSEIDVHNAAGVEVASTEINSQVFVGVDVRFEF